MNGYFPVTVGLQLNRWSSPLDFTNPAADALWRRQLQAYRALGIEGFKLDFAEDVVAGLSGSRGNWTFFDGSTEKTMHAQYTRLYHRAYRATLGDLDGFLIARSGKWGSQQTGLVIWPGDIDATLTKVRRDVHQPRRQARRRCWRIALGGTRGTELVDVGVPLLRR